ncbi:hypothetical protein ACFQ9X_28510 [Catenulispora yoronensis]
MQALRYPGLFGVVVSHAGAFEAPARVGDPYAGLREERDFMIPSVVAHERVWGPVGSEVRGRYEVGALIEGFGEGAGLLLLVGFAFMRMWESRIIRGSWR